MGFIEPSHPDLDPEEFLRKPLTERIKTLSRDWVQNGNGTPSIVHCIYIAKVFFFFTLGGAIIATATSPGVAAFWRVTEWWNEPIVYQKVILWILLTEILGIAGAWGPLMGRIKPMTGGARFFLRRNTIREPIWPWIPGTGGDRRTRFDVGLYAAVLIGLVVPLVSPGVASASLSERLPDNTSGLVHPVLTAIPVVLLLLLAARDRAAFLCSRSDQYLAALLFFSVLPFTDMIIALKMLIFASWVGAAFSKLGVHFTSIVPPMVSNAPWPPNWLRRAQYRDYPHNLRPSHTANFMAHGTGTVLEFVAPVILLFSTNKLLTLVAAVMIVAFHTFIIGVFPIAVPLEWNVVFAYAAVFLFLGFPAWEGYGITDMSSPWLTVVLAVCLLFLPVLGNLRPDKVSFLWAFRQYAGNWATAVWAFAPGAEQKLNRVTRPTTNLVDQFIAYGYEPQWAEIAVQKILGFRAMNPQGRGLISVLLARLPDIDTRTVREGEFVAGPLIGFNFGEGHLHNEDMIRAVQSQVGFEPGECIIAWVESEAFGSGIQRYKLIDAATGVIERGTWKSRDVAREQPWLPNGPVPLHVTWSLSDSDRTPGGVTGGHEALA
jgi:hypothetical protein